MTEITAPAPSYPRLAAIWRALNTREKWFNGFGILIVLISIVAGFATYFLLTEQNLLVGRAAHFYWLVSLNVTLLIALTCTVGWRGWRVWNRRKQKRAGSQLHIQLTTSFSLLAAIPAVLVAIFAMIFIHIGVQAWFGQPIRTAVTESQAIARSYLEEHQQSIRVDMLAMANDLNREANQLLGNRAGLKEYFKTQTYLRNLSEALLITGSGEVIARAGITLSLEFTSEDFQQMLKRAEKSDVVVFVGDNGDRVRALVKLDNFVDTYLFVGRFVDENVLASIAKTNRAVSVYQNLEMQQQQMKQTMTLIFVLVGLMLLMVAIWAGLTLAERIVGPVTRLIEAAERVRAGDLNARVNEGNGESEVSLLARAFNRMTDQLSAQRRDLINANRQLDERRRFSEMVLAGVNAGILALNDKGIIEIANASALKLLHKENEKIVGQKIADICPEIEKIRRVLRSKGLDSLEMPMDIDSIDPLDPSHWIIRMTAEGIEGDDATRRYVVTFDDLSPLIDAQRKAAWADVARRVAHEIKNPLTPIQLSAERLRKKYGKQITEDRETFDVCTDTIIRHVDDIRRMVDEFSAFARMPTATKQNENLVTIIQQVIVLFQQAHREVKFVFDRPEEPIMLAVDRQQISQALTNVIKNAYESIKESNSSNGLVQVTISQQGKELHLLVTDNGAGLPVELLPRLTDPYITTKESGTGLGLAIVAKIIEDHQGRLEFTQNTPHGAVIHMIFPNAGEIKNG